MLITCNFKYVLLGVLFLHDRIFLPKRAIRPKIYFYNTPPWKFSSFFVKLTVFNQFSFIV